MHTTGNVPDRAHFSTLSILPLARHAFAMREIHIVIAQCHDDFTAEVCYIQFDGDKFYVGATRLLNRISSNFLSYHSVNTLTDMLLGPDSGLVT
jgi:hypothetical protein